VVDYCFVLAVFVTLYAGLAYTSVYCIHIASGQMTLLVLEFCDCESVLFLDPVVSVSGDCKDDSNRLSVSGVTVHQRGEMEVSLST